MEHKSIKTTALLIILSVLSVLGTFTLYYVTENIWIIIASVFVISLILSHTFLEISFTYEPGFLFSCLSMILSTIIIILIYFNMTFGLFTYKNSLHIIIYLYWIVPTVYYTYRNLMDKGPRFVGFSSYFSKSTTIFLIYHIANLIYHTIFDPIIIPYGFTISSNNFIPFFSTATHIEDFIYIGTGLGDLFIYTTKLFLLFIPIGFYATLFFKEYDINFCLPFQIVFATIISASFEGISYLQGNTLNIDSCLYRFIGIFIGIFLFDILNIIFLSKTGDGFLVERNRYSFFH